MSALKMISSLLLFILLISCSKNDKAVLPGNEGEITGKIDNLPFRSGESALSVVVAKTDEDIPAMSINAADENGTVIVAVITNFKGTGTYQIVSGPTDIDYEANIVYISPDPNPATHATPQEDGNHGSIQILEYSNKRVRGKFSGKVYDPIADKMVFLTDMNFNTNRVTIFN